MSVAVLITVYSSYSISILPSIIGKFVVLLSGVIFSNMGGNVSFGPPLGGVVVLAHDFERMQQVKKPIIIIAVVIVRLILYLILHV